MVFVPGQVDEWMDCGNKNVTVETNGRMLKFIHDDAEETMISENVRLENSEIIPPCYIAEDVYIINSIIGPNVSIGKATHITNSKIKNSLIQTHSHISNAKLDNAMIGNHVNYNGEFTSVSLGDYSTLD